MDLRTRFQLHFGPYKTPRFRIGQQVDCEVLGEVKIYRISDAQIPWPIGPRRALIVYADLARAIRRESIQAVAHWWGVSPQTVTQWRRKLGITGQQPEGTVKLRRAHFAEPWAEETRRKAWAKARIKLCIPMGMRLFGKSRPNSWVPNEADFAAGWGQSVASTRLRPNGLAIVTNCWSIDVRVSSTSSAAARWDLADRVPGCSPVPSIRIAS